jgi:hypothetical protein
MVEVSERREEGHHGKVPIAGLVSAQTHTRSLFLGARRSCGAGYAQGLKAVFWRFQAALVSQPAGDRSNMGQRGARP